jgi:cell division protein FtsI/penicillin-binding protein 2
MGACFVFAALAAFGTYQRVKHGSFAAAIPAIPGITRQPVTKEALAQALGDTNAFFKLPSEMDIPLSDDGSEKLRAVVQYSFDPRLQQEMEALFRSYSPDYGAFVAMDAVTGRVLAMVSYSRDPEMQDNLALRATFPSASVFKVVTAAAAIEERKLSPDSVIQFNGANHTLYRNNVLKSSVTRWSRYLSLKTAFAQSVNTVFGKIGAFTVGPEKLREYADRFGFNRRIASDLPLQPGSAPIDEDSWSVAQTASGYTRENTMSPLQGALIAAAVANDGIMMEPYVVQSVHDEEGTPIYAAEPRVSSVAVDPGTAAGIRALMTETVARGTSRKSFRGFFKGPFRTLDVGGKTGSLTGMDPPGKYDWFVGYAEGGEHRIAVSALTIHRKLWRVKSSYLARRAFEGYFREHPIGEAAVAANR